MKGNWLSGQASCANMRENHRTASFLVKVPKSTEAVDDEGPIDDRCTEAL